VDDPAVGGDHHHRVGQGVQVGLAIGQRPPPGGRRAGGGWSRTAARRRPRPG
jgi:hypothetical protein